jgi:hypothetical protein
MYKRAKWTNDEVALLGRTLQFKLDAPPKPKRERYFDEKAEKYKFREVEIEKVKCPECSEMFYQKRPKQLFCQNFCRIRSWQKLARAKLKLKKRLRIRKMWG